MEEQIIYQVAGFLSFWPFASVISFGNWLNAMCEFGPSDVISR